MQKNFFIVDLYFSPKIWYCLSLRSIPGAPLCLSPQRFSLKKILFFLKKILLLKSFLYCLKKTFSYIAFSKSLSLKKSFWYFEKSIFGTLTYLKLKAIQDSGTFTTGGIFRTLSNLYDKMFCKKATWHSFKDQVWKIKKVPFKKDSFIFLYFGKFLTLIIRNFLYFLQKKKRFFFISGKRTNKFLLFQETELSYISRNFLYFRR